MQAVLLFSVCIYIKLLEVPGQNSPKCITEVESVMKCSHVDLYMYKFSSNLAQ
jgi:hypothetical protein